MIKTNKNSINVIIWLVVGGSSDNKGYAYHRLGTTDLDNGSPKRM
jgi:hypothetical protein